MFSFDVRRRKHLLLGVTTALALALETVNADFAFDTPKQLPATVNSASAEFAPSVTPDGLSLYFCSNRHTGTADGDVFVSTRASREEPWSPARSIGWPSTTESSCCISADGLSLLVGEGLTPMMPVRRPNGYGLDDIWVATRPTAEGLWNEPLNMGPRINSPYDEDTPELSSDGRVLIFQSDRPGGSGGIDLWMSVREAPESEWGEPVNLGPVVNSAQSDGTPSLTDDGRHLFFHSNRPPSTTPHAVDLYLTSRRTTSGPWGPPVRLPAPVNTLTFWECYPCVSDDARTLYFVADRWAGTFSYYDIWQSAIIPIVDINGDGKVDGFELLAIADRWGENESLYDIGPTPLGDGIIDLQDVTALAPYIGSDFIDPTLVAHWALDETMGDIASESAGGRDGTLIGGPIWRPDAGEVNGALEFDGVDDAIVTDRVLDPANGLFSVFAWVQGGAPGQVIIAQVDGATWLMTDSLAGTLMTELSAPGGRNKPVPPLTSESSITDGGWHRVGLVWDGRTRSLYVDGVRVAEDTQDRLASCSGGLHVGCDRSVTSGTFFTGLIDDIRIYNRAVRP